MTFPEKRACEYEHQTVNTPSPAALRRTTERQTERRSDAPEGSEAEILEVSDAGCAKRFRRFVLILSLRSLKSQVSEEICGRFGSFDGSNPAYQLPRASAR